MNRNNFSKLKNPQYKDFEYLDKVFADLSISFHTLFNLINGPNLNNRDILIGHYMLPTLIRTARRESF